MFEDSFPEIVTTNISSLYQIEQEKPPATPKVSAFSIQHHIDRIDSLNSGQQHSTPVLNGGIKKRLTLNLDDQTSPVRAVDFNVSQEVQDDEKKFNGKGHLDSNLESENVSQEVNLTDGILAELDNDFDLFEDRDTPSRAARLLGKDFTPKSKTNKPNSLRLSESDAAAMRAIADDSNFDSEELFPVAECNRNGSSSKVCEDKSNPPSPSPYSSRKPFETENIFLHGLDEEDFILTQVSNANEIEGSGDETLEDSSEETETSESCSTQSTCNTGESGTTTITISSNSSQDLVQEMETFLGNKKLLVKKITTTEAIPDNFFLEADMIGVGLKVCQKKPPTLARQGIGAKILGKKPSKTRLAINDREEVILALYNGIGTVFMFHWKNETEACIKLNKKKLESLLDRLKSFNRPISMFKSKDKLKSLISVYGTHLVRRLPPYEKIWDPRIAQWMWDFDDEDWNLSEEKLVEEYIPLEERSIPSNTRQEKEILEAVLVWKVMSVLKDKLKSKGLWNHYKNIEMPSQLPIMLMELNGMGLDVTRMAQLKHVLQFKSVVLELRAYQLAGRQFNLNSPKDVKQILFREIGLTQPKSRGTGKDVLLKLEHELPIVIVEWRKVNNALTKFINHFQQARSLETGRVHGHYSHFTVTGRVIMHEPSLQCIPRDFDLNQFTFTQDDINEIKQTCKIKFGSKLTSLFQVIDNKEMLLDSLNLNSVHLISMRNSFVPCNNEFIILSADYSQLELRILAHLSEDEKLLDALNQDTDVFIEIASKWKKLPKEKVTNSMRQEAKGIVYGVIYGMGPKTLSEQMEIDEREATRFMDQFMRIYSGVSSFLGKAKQMCRDLGYIETISGRRRYLPLINSVKPHERAKAERQAVNSQIQGSAADLVKTAMTRIHSTLMGKYPKNSLPIDWPNLQSIGSAGIDVKNQAKFIPILNLHDELIFEVSRTHVTEIANIIKYEMESSLKLRVKLPVIIKTGDSWGNLTVLEI